MLVTAAHSPAWRSQGYVCLACRRAQARAHRQVRFNSQHTETASSDNWFDSLNDISNDFATPAKPPKPKKESRWKEEDSKKAETAKPRPPKKSPTSMTSLFESLKGNLQAKLGHDESEAFSDQPAGRTTDDSASRAHTVKAKKKLEQGGQKPTKEVETSDGTVHSAASIQEEGSQKAPFDVSQLRGLISRLQKETKIKAAQPDQRSHKSISSPGGKANETDEFEGSTELRPFPSFTGIRRLAPSQRGQDGEEAKAVPETPEEAVYAEPRTGTDSDTPVQIAFYPSTSREPGIKHIPIARHAHATSSIPTSFPTSAIVGAQTQGTDRPMRLVDRHRQHLQQLTPFGMSQARAMGVPVTYGSLRGADKVTPETIASSAVNKNPFGLSPLVATADATELLQDSADSSESQSMDDSYSTGFAETEEASATDSDSVIRVEEPQYTPSAAHERLTSLYAQHMPSVETAQDQKSTKSRPSPSKPAAPTKTRKAERRERGKRRPSKLSTSGAEVVTKPGSAVASGESRSSRSNDEGSESGSGMSLADAMMAPRIRRGRIEITKPEQAPEPTALPADNTPASAEAANSFSPSELSIEPLDIPQPPVPYLQYGLDRVLFNHGVYQLQDHDSRVYNFDPYLQNIMPVKEFDFNALKEYKTSSKDVALSDLARQHDKKYIGSTSSMTSSLAHFHFLLSNWRPLNFGMLSKGFFEGTIRPQFTEINRAPSSIFLRWKNGTYAIDADKEYDSANVLMLLGKSMELLLTLPKDQFERYRKADPRQVPEEQRIAPDSFQYTTMGDFLMRSQLDAYDPRLPGNGTFDLKTRAVVSVRMSTQDYEEMSGYEIFNMQGRWGSYEREFYDMARSTMLKYMLQARMGRMNGIFVAYHNVKRIFGFQYLPIHEMDRVLHGQKDTCLGDQEFKASLDMLNEVLNRATAKFPEQSLRIHFETRPGESGKMPTALHVFAEPMAEDEIESIQNSQKAKIAAWERDFMGKEDVEEDVDESVPENDEVSAQHESEVDDADTSDNVEASKASETGSGDASETTTNYQDAVSATSSDSDPDVNFLNSMAEQEEDLKPLFHATLIIQSKVDGSITKDDRPADLNPDQKWEIDYILKEYDTTRTQWALYEDTKARRKYALAEMVEEEDDPEDKKDNYYLRFLRDLAAKSQVVRERIDKLDEGQELVRVDGGLPKEREKIEGVDDYVRWLYKSG